MAEEIINVKLKRVPIFGDTFQPTGKDRSFTEGTSKRRTRTRIGGVNHRFQPVRCSPALEPNPSQLAGPGVFSAGTDGCSDSASPKCSSVRGYEVIGVGQPAMRAKEGATLPTGLYAARSLQFAASWLARADGFPPGFGINAQQPPHCPSLRSAGPF